ncbi:MAG: penicillin-insensitive murein endopeptidase [Planctomycetota bacterium]
MLVRACALTLTFTLGPAAAAFGQSASAPPSAFEVTASALNVREGPGTPHAVRGVLRRGQVYPVWERRGGWARLQLGGREAWASLTYLRPSPAWIRWVLAPQLNVRSGSSTSYRALGLLARGTPVAVTGTSAGWARISYEGTAAWVYAGHLGTARPAGASAARPRSRAGFIQLAAAGTGFESYAAPRGRWARPELVYAVERAARRWSQEHLARIGVGDMSLENGGSFAPHAGHQQGREVDLSPARADERELPVTWQQGAYSRTFTRRLIELLRAEVATEVVLFNDPWLAGVSPWPGHDNHLHLRIR